MSTIFNDIQSRAFNAKPHKTFKLNETF